MYSSSFEHLNKITPSLAPYNPNSGGDTVESEFQVHGNKLENKTGSSRLRSMKDPLGRFRQNHSLSSSMSVPNLKDLLDDDDDGNLNKSKDDHDKGKPIPGTTSINMGLRRRGSSVLGQETAASLKAKLKQKDQQISKISEELDKKEIHLGEMRRANLDLKQQFEESRTLAHRLKLSRQKYQRESRLSKEKNQIAEKNFNGTKDYFFETSLDCMVLLKSNMEIIKMNGNFEKIFGWSKQDLNVKKSMSDYFTPLFSSKFSEILSYLEKRNISLLEDKHEKVFTYISNKSETYIDHKDGRKVPVLISTSTFPVPMIDDKGSKSLLFNVIIRPQQSY